MSALTIAGIDLAVLGTRTVANALERIGSSSRTFNGGLRTTVRAEKHAWTITTDYMLAADVATLEAAIASAAHVTCSGDVLGGTYTCEVTRGDSPYEPIPTSDGLGYMRTLTLTLREV